MTAKGIWILLRQKFLSGETVTSMQIQKELGASQAAVNYALQGMAYMLEWRRHGMNPARHWTLRHDKRKDMDEYLPKSKRARQRDRRIAVSNTPLAEDIDRVFRRIVQCQPVSFDSIRSDLGLSETRLRQVMKVLRGTNDKRLSFGSNERRVYIKEWRVIDFDMKNQVPLYAPGCNADAMRISKGSEEAELIKEAAYKAQKNKWVKEFRPRRDPAAAWF